MLPGTKEFADMALDAAARYGVAALARDGQAQSFPSLLLRGQLTAEMAVRHLAAAVENGRVFGFLPDARFRREIEPGGARAAARRGGGGIRDGVSPLLRLLPHYRIVTFKLGGKDFTAFSTAIVDYTAAILGRHARAKPVGAFAAYV